jgi:YfiR/HmsC-like
VKRWPLLWVVATAASAAAMAHANSLDEDRLRAAFVLRLAQYTQWPTPVGESPTLSLCAAGLQPAGLEAVRALASRAVGGAQIKVRALSEPRDAARDCQVLLLGHPDAATLRQWIAALGDAAVLVVATSPEAMRAGVCIALISESQGMAFAVNHGESKRRGLSLAAPVLKLAREVR